MASLILGSVGSSFLGPIGGFIGSAIGSYIDQALFAPSPADIEGPRLSDLRGIQADPGQPIPLVYGADRIAGIVVHTTDLIETKNKKKVGGKGGGKSQEQITYTYHVDIDYMFCEGPILGIGRIWADGKLIRGTRYQMELDTDVNFEKIGGIPYNRYYTDNVYDAKVVPWSYDPTYTPTIQNQKYRWDFGVGFTAISDAEATRLLDETVDVVYAYDTGSELFLPIPLSHDYTGEVIDAVRDEPQTKSVVGRTRGLSYTGFPSFADQDGQGFVVKVNLAQLFLDVPQEVIGEWIGAGGDEVGTATFTFTAGPGSNTTLGGGFSWNFVVTGYIEAFGPGDVGYTGNRDSWNFSISTNSENEVQTVVAEIPIIQGVEYVEIELQGARSSPALSNFTIGAGSFSINYTTQPTYNSVRNWPDYFNFYDAINDWSPKAVLEYHGADGIAFYPGTDDQITDPTMELIRTDGCGVPAYIGRAHLVFQRLELADYGNRIPNLTFEVVQSDDARVRPTLIDLMDRSGIDPEYYDLTDLPDTGIDSYVMGYSVGKVTSFRAAMEPLIEAFKLDAAEIGNQIIFRRQARAVDHTIDYSELQAVSVGSGPEAPVRLSFRNVIEMPRQLGIRYKDPEREYQVNTAIFTRQITPSVQRSQIDLSIVMPPSYMKGFVRDRMRELWLERNAGAWTLPHRYVHVSPSDTVLIDGSASQEQSFVFKVQSVTRKADGILEMEGVLQASTLYIPEPDETENNDVSRTYGSQYKIGVSMVTIPYFLDIPPLLPTAPSTEPGYYLALGAQSNIWPGGSVYRDDGEAPNEVYNQVTSSVSAAVTGNTLDDILGPIVQENSIDYTNTIDVRLDNPLSSLESVSVFEFFNNSNVALIGNEIVAFKDAVQQPNGYWRLSTLIRGLRGTVNEIGNHTINERFILLETNTIVNVAQDPSLIGTSFDYKAVTLGNQVGSQPVTSFANTQIRLKPFPVSWISALYDDPSNDLVITWQRNDRFGNVLLDGNDIPNSEDFERYEIDFLNATTLDVVDTVSIENATTYTWTAAEQTAAGITVGFDGRPFRIYQMSALVGRGIVSEGEA